MGRTNTDQDYNDDKEIKKAHHFISIKKKQRLIELVEKENFSIYKAAQRLKICHPTAKFIMKTHRTALAQRNDQEGTLNNSIGTPPPTRNSQAKTISEQNSANSQPNIIQSCPLAANSPTLDHNPLQAHFWGYYGFEYFLPSIYYM